MKRLFSFLRQNGLARDNVIFFSASMILNFIGFLYHAYMGRVLGPADYGILGVMQTLMYLLNVVLNVIQTAITRFVSTYKSQQDMGSVSYLFVQGLKRATLYGIFSFVAFAVAGLFLIGFLSLPTHVYFFLGIIIPFVYLLALNRGLLQGLQLFTALGVNNIVEGLFKLFVGVGLVLLGWGVGGAVLGVTASYIGAFIFSFVPLRSLFSFERKKISPRGLFLYSFPVLVVLLALTTLYSFDVLLVKHYLAAEDAGLYAAASLIGKIVFFATLSIIMVMFPKVSESYELRSYQHVKRILNLSLFFVSALSLCIIIFYLFFPRFVVLVLFGSAFLSITPLLWLFALAYALFSLVYTLSLYNLSIKRYSFIWILVAVNTLELLLISFYHASLMSVLSIFSLSLFILLLALLVYTYSHKLSPS